MSLSIRSKLYLIVALLLVPIALLSWLFVAQSRKDINFADAERLGLVWMQSAWPAVSAFAASDGAGRAADLSDLKADGLPEAVVRAAHAAEEASGADDIAAAAGAFRDLAIAIGDRSNLILDPDLDSYYVMDIVVVRLPDLAGRARSLDALARAQAVRADLDDDAKAAFMIELGQIDGAARATVTSLEASASSNPDGSVRAELGEPVKALAAAADAFRGKATEVAQSLRDPATRSAADLDGLTEARKALAAAVDATFEKAVRNLDHLLALRISGFSSRLFTMLGIALAVVALALGTAVVVSASIVRSIDRLDRRIRALGDDDIHAPIEGTDGRDEIAKVARAVGYFRDRTIDKLAEANSEERRREMLAGEKRALAAVADRIRRSVGQVVTQIAEMADSLRKSSGVVHANASRTRTDLVGSIDNLNASNRDVSVVVAAVSEISHSIAEISEQTARSAAEADLAMTRSASARAVGDRLAQTSAKIGEISALIAAIAQQTNLLALNATIEAARAGEAGKGFAVVASEVKQLASQTSRATEEIEAQVEDIRRAADDVLSAVGEVTETITGISSLTTAIAGAVEEQNAAMSEINDSLGRATAINSQVVDGLAVLPTIASGTEAAASDLGELSTALAAEVGRLDSQVSALLTELTDRRHETRLPSSTRVTITVAGRRREGTLADAAPSGLRIAGLGGLPVGTAVAVQLPFRVIEATVAWSDPEHTGLAMRGENQLSDQELGRLEQASEAA